ncbi:MAG: hypothetical protein Q9164_002295 [Protoblastenia rupestris]
MVLAHSLRDNDTKKQLAILVTLDSLSSSTIDELKKVYDNIIPVDRIINKSPANLYLMNRPDLASTFTKIALWRQTQFSHIVYLDSDVVALRAPDELFHSPPAFAAVPDIGWPDCFNSGVLSLKPNMGDYYALLALAQRGISFDGADQGLLNMHFRDWERLSFRYNCTPSGNYQYVPAYRHFQSSISIVHYIGYDKPWVIGREQGGASGVYEELLGRWWAIYDKHYRTPKTPYDSGQSQQQSRTVQQYVTGETSFANYEYSSTSIGPKTGEPKEQENFTHTTEPILTDNTKATGDIDKPEIKQPPTREQRNFSVDWDPRHQSPPAQSRPEAANFPNQVYDMSSDRRLFQAPQPPEPPKNMYYEVPSAAARAEPMKPIFPWEGKAPKATRIFAEDLPPPSTTSIAPSSETVGSSITDIDTEETETDTFTSSTPTLSQSSAEPFAMYSRTNAWDDMPEIERYVSSLPQNRRAKLQVLLNNSQPTVTSNESILSPTNEDGPQPQSQRRPSMKLTDFPTEIERPSLPVTPAPVRRPSFWGAERDAAGELPPAEGVPEQSDWDPVARLMDLQRRQSEVLEKGPAGEARVIPERKMPESSSQPVPTAEEKEKKGFVPSSQPVPLPEEKEEEEKEKFATGLDAVGNPSTTATSEPVPEASIIPEGKMPGSSNQPTPTPIPENKKQEEGEVVTSSSDMDGLPQAIIATAGPAPIIAPVIDVGTLNFAGGAPTQEMVASKTGDFGGIGS